MKQEILTINRAKWRTGDGRNKTGLGETALLNTEGYMCCLGFECIRQGIPQDKILNIADPYMVKTKIKNLKRGSSNTAFANKAIMINDDINIKQNKREEMIKAHFAKKEIKVVFTVKYKKEKFLKPTRKPEIEKRN